MRLKKISLLVLLVALTTAFSVSFFTKENSLRCEVFTVENGYGYRILQNNQVIIYQPFIPAIRYRAPFSSENDARTIGELVCRKIQKGELPAVTEEEITGYNVKVTN